MMIKLHALTSHAQSCVHNIRCIQMDLMHTKVQRSALGKSVWTEQMQLLLSNGERWTPHLELA